MLITAGDIKSLLQLEVHGEWIDWKSDYHGVIQMKHPSVEWRVIQLD